MKKNLIMPDPPAHSVEYTVYTHAATPHHHPHFQTDFGRILYCW